MRSGRKGVASTLRGYPRGTRGYAPPDARRPPCLPDLRPARDDARAAEREAFRSDLALAAAFLREGKG